MRRFLFTAITLISLATAIAQLQVALPMSVQRFMTDHKEGMFQPKGPLKALQDDSKRSIYAPPYELNGVEVVEAFIDIADRGVIQSLEAQGVIVNCEFDGFVTAQIPVDKLESIATMHGVLDVEISKVLELATDSTLCYTRAGEVLNGTEFGLPQAYDGSGVIIGIIDSGFDYQHLTYKQADNDSVTRIVRVYDPSNTTGNPVYVENRQLSGSVFMGEQIDTLTTDASGTHGTHTSSIAAGRPVEGYSGMAPGAEIVLCASRTLNTGIRETEVANCIKYIYAYADSVNKPCVISVSVSVNSGARDGNDKISKAVAQLTGPGRVFVISAGNTGRSDSYCSGPATVDKPLNILLGYKTDYSDEACYYRYLQLDTWVRSTSTRPVMKFHILDKQENRIVWESDPISPQKTINVSEVSDYFEADTTKDSLSYMSVVASLVVSSHKYDITARINNMRSKDIHWDAVQGHNVSRYQIGLSLYPPRLMYPTQADSCYFDSWMCSSYSLITPYPNDIHMSHVTAEGDTVWQPVSNYYATPNNNGSIITYAVHDSIISAGAYTARRSHYSLNEDRIIYTNSTLFDAVGFSGYELAGAGPTGQALPTISAPGVFVIAAGSRYSYFQWTDWHPDLVMRKDGYPYGAMSGTSMAAPTVAGIIAQWLQIDPTLSPGDIKRILAETAIKDEFTGSNPRFGPNGKIDAMAGVRYLLGIGDEPQLVLGDMNGNGECDMDDLSLMINYLLTDDSTGMDLDAGDIDRNGQVDMDDLAHIINLLLTGEV